jgi:NAD(P)-dependent dehydrogenase (short-subunit alcohol dehydrogenase family)
VAGPTPPKRQFVKGAAVSPNPGEHLLEGRVAIVTGAGRGIGRAHALELARQGARVVVNDYGVSLAGEKDGSPADDVVAEIEALGGEAVANGADVADFEQAAAMVQQAIGTFGGLDILVNNAGFVRDRMLVNTSEEEWDAVIRVHLKGHFAPLRHAGAYWRGESKEGRTRAARVINTSSGAGLQGSIGQATYSAAKAGIAGLTLVAAAELGRYGVTVNAIAPVAKTRMTEGAFDTSAMALPEDNSPIVAWLASEEAGDVTGRVIEIDGGRICVEQGWTHGPRNDLGRRWETAEVGAALRALIAEAGAPEPVYGAS